MKPIPFDEQLIDRFLLHTYMEGKSNEQVARLLRCPVGTVKWRLSHARDLLRARLSQCGWDSDEAQYRWG
jgi:DNA-directed RNA polymerase specialized sigma24 family protein